MEEKNCIRISRLPKYGTKADRDTSLQSVPNGTAPNFSRNSHIVDKNISKHNANPRASSFSFNWRKSNKYHLGNPIRNAFTSNHNSNKSETSFEKGPRTEGKIGKEEFQVGSSNTFAKTAQQSNMFVSPAEKLSRKSLSALSNSAFTKSSLLSRTSRSGFSAPKSHLNGICRSQSMVSMQRSRGIMAGQSSSGETLRRSTDNVTSGGEKMIRSQSFSHSMEGSLLPSASLTRSHSFNRAVDLTRPYPNHLAIRTPQRSNLWSRSARQIDPPNGNEPLRCEFARPFAASAPHSLKKQTLSNGTGDAPSMRFRLGCPSFLKPLDRRIPLDGSVSKGTAKHLAEDLLSAGHGRDNDAKGAQNSKVVDSNCKVCTDGDADEISISSLSSSEKNDLSEDFSDDFIELEDPSRTNQIQEEEILTQELEHGNGIPLRQLQSLQEKKKSDFNDEWLDICMSEVDDKSESAEHPTGNHVVSSDMDYRAGSSFELSPSDSSDGTYLWDEEGLEPIGSVQPCGSYDSSEMNSIDILNNLDSCDLEDDDLMLEVDLPEDSPQDLVDYENMNRYERADRHIRPQKEGLWKRTPQRWTTQECYHLGPTAQYHHGRSDLNRSCNYLDFLPVSHPEGYGASSAYPPLRNLPPNTVMLDEMTLRHMVQDCTAVKTQLLKMKKILHQNEENMSLHNIPFSLPTSPEQPEPEPVSKADELLSEITQLKEDLRKKDETIRDLEHQLSVQCICSKESKTPEVTVGKCADKYTQTFWRRNALQVLQPSSHLPRFTDLLQGRLTRASHTVAHSEPPHQDQREHVVCEAEKAAIGSSVGSQHKLSTLNTQLNDKSVANAHSIKNEKVREKPKEIAGQEMNTLQSQLSSTQPSIQLNMKEAQTKPVLKSHSLRTYQMPPQKTLREIRASKQDRLVPLSGKVAASTLQNSPAEEPELSLGSPGQPHLAPTPSHLPGKIPRASKLRPPAISYRTKQATSPLLVPPLEHQGRWPLASHPKPLPQAKGNLQRRGPVVSSGDGVTSVRQSRLPKPKT